ncbi:MAG: Mcm2-7 hexameric complex component [Watsoniomyces obsoletus]|nr:MAG: Mcm2-7 hexameric complex component [Watsoniomyces obsoletus]
MPASTRRERGTSAETVFADLKSCLGNLPPPLVAVLENANTPVQHVVVELSYSSRSPPSTKSKNVAPRKSAYAGWTGMSSKSKTPPLVNGHGIFGGGRGDRGTEREVQMIEIDKRFGQLLGLVEGQKVDVSLHLDAPSATTVCIEPLTAADWEIIELHASFLELNLLSQIRALPNPFYQNSGLQAHPLILHLSPTSSAAVLVTSLTPAPSSDHAFARIAPDAEVIVAPKSRARNVSDDTKSQTVITRDENEAGTSISSRRPKNRTGGHKLRRYVHFRMIDRCFADQYFQSGHNTDNEGLRVWLGEDNVVAKPLEGARWVSASVIKPTALLPPTELRPSTPHHDSNVSEIKPATRVIAELVSWDNAPDGHHAVLSSMLCAGLGVEGDVGGIVRLEAAPTPLPKKALRSIQIHPFISPTTKANDGLVLGGSSKTKQEQLKRHIEDIYRHQGSERVSVFDGPITDHLVLGSLPSQDISSWEGGLVTFNSTGAREASQITWFLGSDHKFDIEVQQPIPRPPGFSKNASPDEALPAIEPSLESIDDLTNHLIDRLSFSSSVLLTGGIGSGKTSLAQLLGHRLRRESFFHVSYFPCSKLVTDETRVSTIKETLNHLFITASLGAYLGGHAVVILDDLDKLCPVETELQVGNDNSRSRQVTELLCKMTKQFCGRRTGVVLLATASSKDAIHNLIIKTHAVKDIVELKAPDKEARRSILEGLITRDGVSAHNRRGGQTTGDTTNQDSQSGFIVDPELDSLELAGKTDGYMPGDLILLISRAKSEALLRYMPSFSLPSSSPQQRQQTPPTISLTSQDFSSALQGFTPASLRNVRLHSSSTTFASIGGLQSVRKTLIETLHYPTKYARIFAKCPLRLRSGLLLYGYPGCGKTLLASAVAGESGLNFISVKGPEMLNKYIGASEKAVRDLFDRAQAARPAVLFFDEFDSIAPKRGHDSTGVTDRVVNQLLTQMDGAEGLQGVYVLAATSRPDLIDPALLRPGRLDKSLLCDLPGLEERLDILRVVSRDVKMAEEVRREGLEEVARQTEGYSGADLQAVISNAQLEAIHRVLDGKNEKGKDKGKGKGKERANEVHQNGPKVEPSEPSKEGKEGDQKNAETEHEQQQEKHDEKRTSEDWLVERERIIARLDVIRATKEQKKLRQKDAIDPESDTSEDEVDEEEGEEEGIPQSIAKETEQNQGVESSPGEDENKNEGGGVEIIWSDIQSSLEATQSSISIPERLRLGGIYREFMNGGRTGEMFSGEASMEVGGRISLM